MQIELICDNITAKKGDCIIYHMTLTPKEDIDMLNIEIIPTAEAFPDSNIIIDPYSVTVSDNLKHISQLNDNGIFEITVEENNSDKEINLSFNAQVTKNFKRNTTAVIASYSNNGSINEAYAHTAIDGPTLPIAVPVICSFVFIIVSGIMIKQFI